MKSTETVTTPSTRQLISAVLWSFFGVRKMASLSQDMRNLKPQWLILTAVIGAAAFIAFLLTLVQLALKLLAV